MGKTVMKPIKTRFQKIYKTSVTHITAASQSRPIYVSDIQQTRCVFSTACPIIKHRKAYYLFEYCAVEWPYL